METTTEFIPIRPKSGEFDKLDDANRRITELEELLDEADRKFSDAKVEFEQHLHDANDDNDELCERVEELEDGLKRSIKDELGDLYLRSILANASFREEARKLRDELAETKKTLEQWQECAYEERRLCERLIAEKKRNEGRKEK